MSRRYPGFRIKAACAVAGAVLLAGCGAEPEADADGLPIRTGRHGLMTFTQTFGNNSARLSGQLMAWRGQNRLTALEALGDPELAWLAQFDLAPGECLGTFSDTTEPLGDERIDLLSAGAITARAPAPLDDVPIVVQPKPFPPLLFSIAGSVYDAETSAHLPYLAGGTYTLDAPGDEVGPMRGEVRAPAPVWLDAVDTDSEGLHVSWGGGGVVLISVSNNRGARSTGVLCGTDASGQTLISAAALASLDAGEVRLTVARIEHGTLSAGGLDQAELLFITQDRIDLTLPELAP